MSWSECFAFVIPDAPRECENDCCILSTTQMSNQYQAYLCAFIFESAKVTSMVLTFLFLNRSLKRIISLGRPTMTSILLFTPNPSSTPWSKPKTRPASHN